MRVKVMAAALAVLGVAVTAFSAEDFWTKKEWHDWSKSDCNKMLQNSPWAKTVNVDNENRNGALPSVSTDVGMGAGSSLSSKGAGQISYYIELRSATPIRLALIRLEQIQQKYEKKSDAEKQEFDKSVDAKFGAANGNQIAVRVSYFSQSPELARTLADYWNAIPANSYPPDAALVTEQGLQVTPIDYAAAKGTGEFLMVFPRENNGKLLIADGAKSIKIQFSTPTYGDFPAHLVSAEFRLDQLLWQGKPDY
jgi:hypothetical protein